MPLRLLCTVFMALPWLWPVTAGPAAPMVPYLASVTAGALLLASWPAGQKEDSAVIATSSWLSAALLSSGIGLLQYFDLEAAFYPWVNIARPGLAFGNLRQPNQLASLLVIGMLALRWLAQVQRLNPQNAAWMGGLLLVGLAATGSRAGLTELLIIGAVMLWWSHAPRGTSTTQACSGEAPQPPGHRASPIAWAGAAMAVYLLAAVALPALLEITQGVSSGRDVIKRLLTAESICGSRLTLWRNVLHLISLKPWVGWGWGELDYAHYITLYDSPRFCNILDNAHNLPLHLAVELGAPVALATCALVGWWFWRGKPWAEKDATRQLAWGVLGAIGIHSMVEYPLWYGPFQLAAIWCVWILWQPRGATPAVLYRPSWLTRRAVSAIMLMAVAYVAWDYHRISQLFLPAEKRATAYRVNTRAYAERSWLFADVVRFASVTTQPATLETAPRLLPAALAALHFSPEPRTIIRVIESASLLGQDDLALAHMARFRAAFPREYLDWTTASAGAAGAAP